MTVVLSLRALAAGKAIKLRPSDQLAMGVPGLASYGVPDISAFRVHGNYQGLANRLGWWLTATAIAWSINSSAEIYSFWPGQWPSKCCNYDAYEIASLMHLPLTIVSRQVFNQLNATAVTIPFHPPPYVNDYTMEPAWHMWGAWDALPGFFLQRCLTTRLRYEEAYRRAQALVQPNIELCNPPRRSYVAVHIRRGDKARTASIYLSRKNATHDPRNNLTGTPQMWKLLSSIAAARPDMSWLFLSDSRAARREAEARAQANGWHVANQSCDMKATSGVRRSSRNLPGKLVSHVQSRGVGGVAQLGREHLDGPQPAANKASSEAPREFVSHMQSKQNSKAVVQDLFALAGAAGAVTSTPRGDREESSFATVSALMGDVPLLHPFPFKKYGALSKVGRYEVHGNSGAALRNIFFEDDILRFVEALSDRTVHSRHPHNMQEYTGDTSRMRATRPCASLSSQLAGVHSSSKCRPPRVWSSYHSS